MFVKKLCLSLGLFVILSGCGSTPATPTVAPTLVSTAAPATIAPTVSAPLIKIQVAYSGTSAEYAPLWVAHEAGFFKKNGLDAGELVAVRGGTRTAQTLLSGDVQFAEMSPSSLIEARAAGSDPVTLLGMITTMDYNFIVRPEIKTPADLKGKKLAVSGPTGDSVAATRYAVKELFHLDPDKDITLVIIGSEPERLTALQSKQVDATVLNPELDPKVLQAGMVILEKLWNKGVVYQGQSISARRSYIDKNPQVVRAFVKSMVEAIAFMKNLDNEAQVLPIMGKYLGVDDHDYLDNGYRFISQGVLQRVPYPSPEGMQLLIAQSAQATEKGLKAEQMIDNSFVKELDASGYISSLYK